MKIAAAQLAKNLTSMPLPAVIWLSGDEPLLVLEASDLIRAQAKKAGIELTLKCLGYLGRESRSADV